MEEVDEPVTLDLRDPEEPAEVSFSHISTDHFVPERDLRNGNRRQMDNALAWLCLAGCGDFSALINVQREG
ncbi:hypothetical protein CSC34_4538 [Pseudomonas aeruginosa]|nr:hypothetical protein [Pseudomonas aeruginosa]RAL79270.1 hypothetical protein CSC34_4538 [Pseudomonas aeruginosa]